jgi:hypothetical protein
VAVAPDTTGVSGQSVPASRVATSSSVPITILTATDNGGVAGHFLAAIS